MIQTGGVKLPSSGDVNSALRELGGKQQRNHFIVSRRSLREGKPS